nr:MAG TPA: holin [Caudoviricetes sp.]
MDGLLNQLTHLRPTDMSIVMLVVALIDLWAAVSLSIKAKSTLSKSLIYGLINNLLIISIPFGLQSVVALIPADHADTTYVTTVSTIVTVLYVVSALTSIVANYSAAYPQSKNWLTKIAYKYLPQEVANKQDKHGITIPSEPGALPNEDQNDARG